MRQSIRLGSISGIPIGLHWSILLIGAVVVASLSGTILPGSVAGYSSLAYFIAAVTTALLFLGSIVAHELGHSIVAQRNKVGVASITLFALGGVAELEEEPKSPGAAARIAIAGPAVSVAVGVVSLFAAALSAYVLVPALVVTSLTWLGVINIALALFNMIPALPLDGGRVLQAAIWKRRGGRHEATVAAAKLGRLLGYVLIGLGLWQFAQTGDGLWTAFIGWFVVSSARAESARAQLRLRRPPVETAANYFADHALWRYQAPTAPRNARPGLIIDVESRLVATHPVTTQPVATQPVATQPVATQPVATQPVATQPVVTQPVGSR